MSAFPNSPFLIASQPEGVVATECYRYTCQVSDIAFLELSGAPTGEIRTCIPLDGDRGISSEVLRKLKDPDWLGRGSAVVQAGWLAVGKPLDWEGDWEAQTGFDGEPGARAVRFDLKDADALLNSGELNAVASDFYAPAAPCFHPLDLEINIYDGNADSTAFLGNRTGQARQQANLYKQKELEKLSPQEALKKLSSDILKPGRMLVELVASVQLPYRLVDTHTVVNLPRLSLDWPMITSKAQVAVTAIDKNGPVRQEWRYNPDTSAIEVVQIPVLPQPLRVGSPLVAFEARVLFLVDYSGELAERNELQGKIQFEIPDLLLSGRQVAWLNTVGHREDMGARLSCTTLLENQFRANLSSRFQLRRVAVHREWSFPGVNLTFTRLNDIAAALTDIGYQADIGGVSQAETPNKTVCGFIQAGRWEMREDRQPDEMRMTLWVLQIEKTTTQHEFEVIQGDSVRTEFATGDLVVVVNGECAGTGDVLARDMDQLMVSLKNRLMAVANLR